MNYKSIIKILAIISSIVLLFFSSELLIGYIYDEDVVKLLKYILYLLGLNISILLFLKSHKINLKIKESILTVNLLWILLGVLGGFPLYLYTDISFASAFFEAISGFTTTGATVYSDIESLPHHILFHRSLMHWLGGMGVIVLSVGLLSMINPTGGLSLFKAESTGIGIDKVTPKIKDTALSLWSVYLVLTLLDMLLLFIFGMDWFDALNHAFSTISTGGFSTKNASLGYWSNDGIIWTTTIFMILSGVNFLAHIKLFNQDSSGYKSEEVRWYFTIFLLLSFALSYYHYEVAHDSFTHSLKHSFFTIASVITTTGFATVDYGLWSHGSIALIFIAMFIGGNAGSTAGGVKVIRYVIIFKTLFSELKKILHPSSLISVFVDGAKLPQRVLSLVFVFFFLYLTTVIGVTIYIYLQGYDTMTAISGALAVVGNIGPGFSKVDPACNFSFFSDQDKYVLSFAMIIGRLECFTVFVLFTKEFWKRF
jgi:trk system potassium uptake protein TrkH